ncbi:MAG: hypothetical protein GKR88_01020 [Flavobacteriaceae bacterium]|nr:MAG: hypothetical protein GKR88_01020 [Flavobacteriaceae bacterium]
MSKGTSESNDTSEELSNIIPSQPQSKIKNMLEEIELLALHKERGSGIDISSFNESQKDKLLDIMAKNEENAFSFYSKRLETEKDIEIKRLDTSIVNQKTLKIIV